MKSLNRIIVLLVVITAGCSGIRKTADERTGEPQTIQEVEPVTPAGFKATGNEPFWALEIEFDNILKFTSLTEKYSEFTFPETGAERPNDLSLVKYRAKTYNAETEILIEREKCQDTMKDTIFPYSVTVSIRRSNDDTFKDFKGCGRYLGPYRLNDIWTLQEIDGKPLDIPGTREKPFLEIDLVNKVIYGYGGCNKFHGRAELVNNILVTGSILSTKMACLDTQHIEDRFLRVISAKSLRFEINGNVMHMTDGETELHFRRAK